MFHYFRLNQKIFFPLSVVALLSCAAPVRVSTFPSLVNQGQLALSTTNSSLGSNLFLSREMERSSYLHNFLHGRGAPTAIELIEEDDHPTRLLLYYPSDKEVYAGDLQIMGKDINAREWVVRGPYQIERKDFKNLLRMEMAMNGAPVFEINGQEVRFRNKEETPVRRIVSPLPPPIPTPKPKPKKKVIYQSSGDGIQQVDPRDWRPLNTDQQAIQMAKGFAERAWNGDVIHTVKAEGESLDAIAKWYTGSSENGAKLAELNHLAAGTVPAVGGKITIPLKMVKEFKRMP